MGELADLLDKNLISRNEAGQKRIKRLKDYFRLVRRKLGDNHKKYDKNNHRIIIQ